MERMEKVERLREKANVSYEEARAALEAAGDDLLDAMVLLEKQGKVKTPEQGGAYSTSYEEQKEYVRVQDKVEEQKKSAPSFGKSVKRVAKLVVRFVTHTSFRITRNEKTLFTMPSWVFALILFFSWKAAVPAMIIALFFGIRYAFEGDEDTTAANDFLSKAGSFADGVQSELQKEKEAEEKTAEEKKAEEKKAEEKKAEEKTAEEIKSVE